MRVLTLRVSHIRGSQSQMRTPIPECGALLFLANCTVLRIGRRKDKSYKPHGYSLLVGDLNRSVYGKLPKEWGEFPPLTVLMAANAIKGKVDKYLSTQENLDKILREVE